MSDSESDTPARPARISKHRQVDESDDESTSSPRDKKRVKLEKAAADARGKKRIIEESEDEDEEAPRPAPRRGRDVAAVEDEDMDDDDPAAANGNRDNDGEGNQVKQQLVRDKDGYVPLHAVREGTVQTHQRPTQLCNGIHRPDRVPFLPHVRQRRIPPRSRSQHDHRSERHREKYHRMRDRDRAGLPGKGALFPPASVFSRWTPCPAD